MSSGANTRKIRGFYKILNSNDLRLRVVFRIAKSTISACEMGHFRGQNRPYCILIWALSDCEMGNIGKQEPLFELWYRVYQKAVQYKIGFITMYLTFLYTSFTNLFCQNNVKKICKSDSRVFNKCDDMGRRKGYKRYDSDGRL